MARDASTIKKTFPPDDGATQDIREPKSARTALVELSPLDGLPKTMPCLGQTKTRVMAHETRGS